MLGTRKEEEVEKDHNWVWENALYLVLFLLLIVITWMQRGEKAIGLIAIGVWMTLAVQRLADMISAIVPEFGFEKQVSRQASAAMLGAVIVISGIIVFKMTE